MLVFLVLKLCEGPLTRVAGDGHQKNMTRFKSRVFGSRGRIDEAWRGLPSNYLLDLWDGGLIKRVCVLLDVGFEFGGRAGVFDCLMNERCEVYASTCKSWYWNFYVRFILFSEFESSIVKVSKNARAENEIIFIFLSFVWVRNENVRDVLYRNILWKILRVTKKIRSAVTLFLSIFINSFIFLMIWMQKKDLFLSKTYVSNEIH